MVERTSKFLLIVAVSVCFMLILYQYVGPGLSLGSPSGRSYSEELDLFPTPDPHYVKKYYFPVRELERELAFDMKGEDVIVFLHIQKTGGTRRGRREAPRRQDAQLTVGDSNCELLSESDVVASLERVQTPRFQLGSQINQAVGVLVSICTKKFYYITLLRDPVSRYLSEWRHVQRGATWKTSLHMCDGRTPTPEELPSCYEGTDWSGCTLQEFMDCPYNLANNRQVRMLADLSLVGCYNMSFIPENKRAQILLESAKKNLKDMAFFGLTEFQRKTQYLFERTFNLKFIRPFMQYNSTRAGGVEVDNDTIRRIEELNDLDMQLYDYAKDLFQQRYQYKRQLERMEQRIKNREERLLHRSNEALPKEETEEQGRLPTEDYMSHIIEKW
ncbi:PREDICTED: heparan-sulfate 6-O-sulfotransferase 1 [Charadrius vociferus]|uniref:heparan-sulfate 6-O-sulfotransferase 1 n=1 Tax=Charadrius vociferus TaxID=50402 RepID=UPI000521B361|nr:PREDICTED: heparan-sulfate 6-O-sulfotransferase 1 [Charadrius vociferus]